MAATAVAKRIPDGDEAGETRRCPACLSGPVQMFYGVEDVPTNSCLLFDTAEEARGVRTGKVALGLCEACGLVFNTAFDRARTEYSGRYEETQAFSGTFNRFHVSLADRLIERYDLRGKTVMEIGCGKGEFLMLVAERGNNRGIGIDPGVHPERLAGTAAERLTFIPDLYSERYAQDVDFLVCKMTLEHIPDPFAFMALIRRGLGARRETVVFFQVPEAGRILRDCAFEDIYYEHCSYYTPGSLARLFRKTGFDIIAIGTEYDGQYLTIEARPSRPECSPSPSLPQEHDLDSVQSLVARFPARCARLRAYWTDRIMAARRANEVIVLWGSGSKAVSFLTTLGVGEAISGVTDINPYRQGHFMPGTGHRIVAPSELALIRPDLVIVMNPIYENEVREDLAKLGLTPRLSSLSSEPPDG
jgi:SAM-dependent methyltransferase